MVTITFPDREAEAKGLDYLRGRFPYRTASGEHVVQDAALAALTTQDIPFAVTGRPPAAVHRDPDIMSGMPVFVGTRVPARTLFFYLAGGDTLETFLDHFPSVTREQAVACLDAAQEATDAHAGAV